MGSGYESFISIIIPCYNEKKFIDKCLNSILVNDYRKDKMEVLIIDGMSDDGTRYVIEQYMKDYKFIHLLDNAKRHTAVALNIGIKNARGQLILWMSAHNLYEKQYISKCIKYMEEFHADAVGGIIKSLPRNNNFPGKLICIAVSHPFGVGRSLHKIGTRIPQWVDTAFGTCYKREVFQRIGFFNEKLVRGQDMEFSLRLKKAGIKTLLAPDLISYYYTRTHLKSFIKHNFINGLWAILPFKYSNIMPVSLRHLVPLVFVLSLIGFGLLSLINIFCLWALVGILGAYLLLNIYFSIQIAIKEKDLRLFFLIPILFATLHISYGLGSVLGLIKCLISKDFWIKFFKREI